MIPMRGWKPRLSFADRLRLVRIQYGAIVGERVGQREMAQLLGVSQPTYGSWEAGVSVPRHLVPTAKKIVDLTGVNAAWLLGLDRFDPGPPAQPVATSDSDADLPEHGSWCIQAPRLKLLPVAA